MTHITNHVDQALGRLITQYRGEKIISPPPPPPPNYLEFLGVGHSYVQGTISGQGTTGNSYRREMYYRCRTHYGMSWSFVGLYGTGDIIPTQYSSGVPSQSSTQLDGAINGYLTSAFPSPTVDACVLMGPIGFADCLNLVPLATFKANIDSIINKIHVHSPLIKIFVLTDPYCAYAFPPGQYINDYANEVKNAYNDALAAKKNVYLIDLNSQSIHIGPDNIHPDWLGYEQMGEYINDMVASNLNVTAINLLTILYDSFSDTNGVLLKNHPPDIDLFGNGWSDPNDRCEIFDNYAHEINTVGFKDTLYDTLRVVGTFRFKLYSSVSGNTYITLKSNSGTSLYLFMFLKATTNELGINSQGGVYAVAPFINATSTWYSFKAVIRGNSIEIFDDLDNSIIHFRLSTTHTNFTRLGIAGYFLGERRVDDFKFESY